MFDALPDDARLWIFAADRPLEGATREGFLGAIAPDVAGWASHGRPVPAEAAWLEGRFFAVAAYLGGGLNAGVSGCGIDALTRAAEAAAAAHGFAWADALHVAFRDASGSVQVVPRPAFRSLAREGRVTADTAVFDLALDRLGALREGAFERPAGASWHGRAFRLGAPAGA